MNDIHKQYRLDGMVPVDRWIEPLRMMLLSYQGGLGYG
jgi:hypothetical protein